MAIFFNKNFSKPIPLFKIWNYNKQESRKERG